MSCFCQTVVLKKSDLQSFLMYSMSQVNIFITLRQAYLKLETAMKNIFLPFLSILLFSEYFVGSCFVYECLWQSELQVSRRSVIDSGGLRDVSERPSSTCRFRMYFRLGLMMVKGVFSVSEIGENEFESCERV